MVLDNLGDSLRSSLDSLRDTRSLSEEDIAPVVKEIQRALLQADVDVDLVMTLTEDIKARALETDPPAGTSARDHVLRVVYEELVELVGDGMELPLEDQTILLAGLQGSGKTTTSAKLAWWLSTKGMRPTVIQTDTDRPGAHSQTEQMADRANVPSYTDADGDDPVSIAKEGLESSTDSNVNIVDTAGRHALEDDLIDEIESIAAEVQPDVTLLVLDAAIGQGAKKQAQRFNDAIGIDGVVITKLDGTAKGGGALAAVNEANAPIAFLGTGEEVKDVERFEPDGFVSRLLGMGDLKQLSERVERAFASEGDDDDWDPEDMLEGSFTLVDMRKQMQAMDDMGPLDQVLDMIPGMGGMMGEMPDDALGTTQERLQKFEIIMDSMTDNELEDPSIISTQRIRRIASGSGMDEEDVRELLDQHEQMEKMLSGLRNGGGSGGMQRMMKKLQGEMGGGGSLPF